MKLGNTEFVQNINSTSDVKIYEHKTCSEFCKDASQVTPPAIPDCAEATQEPPRRDPAKPHPPRPSQRDPRGPSQIPPSIQRDPGWEASYLQHSLALGYTASLVRSMEESARGKGRTSKSNPHRERGVESRTSNRKKSPDLPRIRIPKQQTPITSTGVTAPWFGEQWVLG